MTPMTSAASLSGRRWSVASKFRSESLRSRLVLVLCLVVVVLLLLLRVLCRRLFPFGGKDNPDEISTERKIAIFRTPVTSLVNPDLLSNRN